MDTHEAYTQELEEKIDTEAEYLKDLNAQLLNAQTTITELGDIPNLPQTEYSKLADALQHKHNLETMTEQLGEKAGEDNPYTDQITGLRESGIQEISFETMNELTHLQEHQEFLYKLLTSKDSFIRKKIIDQNICIP